MTEKQTVAGAYSKIEAHEDICALRYEGINRSIAELKGLLHLILTGTAGVVIAITGWLAVQVFNANARAPAERPAVVQGR